jgi:hypothetical protein
VNVRVEVLVPAHLDAVDTSLDRLEHSLTADVQTSEGTATSQLSFYVENGLELDEIVFTVDNDEYSCDPDNGDLNLDCDDELEEIPPRASLSMEAIIDNIFDTDSDLDFQDVDLEIDSDNSDVDPDDTSEEDDIDADESWSFSTGFDIDDDVEDGDDATIEIRVEVEDENGARHGFRHEADLQFELPQGVVDITEFSVSPTRVCAGDAASVDFEIENKGSDDQDNVRFTIVNSQLDIDEVYSGIDIEDAEQSTSDRTYEDTFRFTVDNDVSAGQYNIRGTVYYEDEDNDDVSEFITATLTVEDCTPQTTPTDDDEEDEGNDSIIVTPPTTQPDGQQSTGGQTGSQPVPAVVAEDDNAMVIALIVVLVILAIIVIYLFVVLLRRR